jgi:hypothetical protein
MAKGQQQAIPQSIPLTYARDLKVLVCKGVDLNHPIDSIPDGHYPILENLRSYTDGVIQPRQGLTSIANVVTNQTPIHSIRRLNNKLNTTFTRVVGSGTKLSTGQGSFTNVQYNAADVAFSGNPLAMVPWRPDQSPVSWMYVADSTNMYKVSYDGASVSTHKIGVAPPTTPPTIEIDYVSGNGTGQPFAAGGILNAGSVGRWAADGTVATGLAAANRFSVGVTAAIYDSGSTGNVCVVPTSMASFGPGTIINAVDGLDAAFIMVWEVYIAGSTSNNSVARILYDNNPTNTGTCVIVPSGSSQEIKRNCVVRLNGGTNYFRVTEVYQGVDNNTIAFRCNTGATTISATQSLQVVSSFRTNVPFTLSGASTLTSERVAATFAVGGGGQLIGNITYTPAASLDLTNLSGVVGNAFTDSDYFHFSVKAADLAQITQMRIMFDVDDGTFLKNHFYRAITPSDLVGAAKATQTALTTRTTQVQNRGIENSYLAVVTPTEAGDGSRKHVVPNSSGDVVGNSEFFSDYGDLSGPRNGVSPNTPRDQTGTGDAQWSEIRFHRSDCVRVGTDWSKGWQAVAKIRFEISLVSGATATLNEFSSLNDWGGGGQDIGEIGAGYNYRYRYRVPTTGAVSNWSPETNAGLLSLRVKNTVTCTAPSSLPEVTVVDVQRVGGLVSSWATVGSVVSPYIFTDTLDDDAAFAALPDSEGDNNFQPWICSQPPKTGTATTVAGVLVKDSGTNFLTTWIKGTGIKVNGINTTIRRVLSTSLLELENSVGQGTSLPWEVPEPFIQQALPCLWGPINGWFFACGDATNPGRLYFSNKNNPDGTGYTTQGESWVEVTGPSEPLQNGFSYNGRNYVFSSERLYEIVEVSDGLFIPRETPTGKGLMYRWSFCVGPRIWFLSKDGIYETDGGIARSVTFDQLFPLFPKEGRLGNAVNGFNAPNVTTGNITVSGITADASTFFKLAYYDDYLYFIYPDTSNAIRCLTYQIGNFSFVAYGTSQSGWYPDIYNPGGTNTGIFTIYGEEGDGVHNLLLGGADTTTAKLYSYGGTTDAGTNINWHLRQGCFDAGDKRSDKIFADFIVSADPGGGTINVAAGINEYGSTVSINNPVTSAATITGSGRVKATFDINSGNGVEARNIAIDLSGTGNGASLYLIEPSFAPRPEDSFRRATQYDDMGYEGEKWIQGIEIETDTQNIARSLQIQYDGGTVADTLPIQHNGRLMKPYSFVSGFVAHLARLAPQDSLLWKLYKWKWIWEPEPPLVTVWDTQQTSHGHIGFIHLKAIWITHTSTADLTLTITRMDDNTSQAFTIPNSAGVRGKENYILLGPASFLKGKTFKYKITQATNTPFRIYQRHCGVLVKPWGSAQAYARWVGWGWR